MDVLVANAALPGSGKLESFTSADVERALRVNLESADADDHALLPGMLERGEGHFVMIASLAGFAPTAASRSTTRPSSACADSRLALREDLRGTGVGASLVSPGFIRDAGMFADSGASSPRAWAPPRLSEVGAAVVEAIEKDRGEITVAPFRQVRRRSSPGAIPELAGRLSNKAAVKAGDEVARGQRAQRASPNKRLR